VTNLAAPASASGSVNLTWTAPGDDNNTGTAASYDVRYSTATITSGNWSSAVQAAGEPSPQAAGGSQTFTVTGLSAGTTYYFALKTADEASNLSALSNVVS
ncbi:fibronectin type III domain-containing protein, partial [Paenibacillus sepulcri]|nr:fibronectin type III domain-containing protein [Paenibacillus sepulcri]